MPKDYAKRVMTTYKKPKKKKLGLLWVVIPVALLSLSVYLLLNYTHFFHYKKNSQIVKAKQPPKQPILPPPVHFDFYTELPNQKVPDSLALAASQSLTAFSKTASQNAARGSKSSSPSFTSPNKPAEEHYFLLFGQFNNPADATQLRLTLLLKNCEADMVESSGSPKKSFRVQKGPYLSQQEALKYKEQLEKNGIHSQLKKV